MGQVLTDDEVEGLNLPSTSSEQPADSGAGAGAGAGPCVNGRPMISNNYLFQFADKAAFQPGSDLAPYRAQALRIFGPTLAERLFEIGNALVVDGSRKGNYTRWINHSCDPNCVSINISSRATDGVLYNTIGFVAIRRIEAFTELTFDYSDSFLQNLKQCLCKSATCRKREPCPTELDVAGPIDRAPRPLEASSFRMASRPSSQAAAVSPCAAPLRARPRPRGPETPPAEEPPLESDPGRQSSVEQLAAGRGAADDRRIAGDAEQCGREGPRGRPDEGPDGPQNRAHGYSDSRVAVLDEGEVDLEPSPKALARRGYREERGEDGEVIIVIDDE